MSLPSRDKHSTRRSFPSGLLRVRSLHVLVDITLFAGAFYAAYLVRFEGEIPTKSWYQFITVLPYLVLARFVVNMFFGVYRIVWRYVGLRESIRIAQAIGLVSLGLLLLRLHWPSWNLYLRLPIGIIVLEGTFSFILGIGVRMFRRVQLERRVHDTRSRATQRPLRLTLLIGAGDAGLTLAKEAQRSADLGIKPVGFLDDDEAKKGMEVHGVRVLGPLSELAHHVEELCVEQVYITTSTIPSDRIAETVEVCRGLDLDVRIVPALYEILGNPVEMRMLREVGIEDLLSRDPVPPSMSFDDLTEAYRGKRILVTGAGGSIGSELCRQLIQLRPESLLVLERDENNLFEVDRQLQALDPDQRRVPLLVDITDSRALERVFKDHQPNVVFHAAAYKHVPMMEEFPASAALNNLMATRSLVELAKQNGCESFMMISTDKAVNPTSVMGATKRAAELVVQSAAPESKTRFSCVRFGNVLGSRGSVVGIFREQIEGGGPVTVTHEDATRYFMTVHEAVNLVLQAATLGEIGDVFMLDMGAPVRIMDLAKQMIRLSGFSDSEIPIEIIGFRPGEKLFEELRVDGEGVEPTPLRKVFRVSPAQVSKKRLERIVERMDFLIRAQDHAGVRDALHELQIGYDEVSHSASAAPDAAPR